MTGFGEKLRKRRTALKLTLDQVGEAIGSSKAYVWQLENKENARPSGALLQKLADVLEVDVTFFTDESDDVPSDQHLAGALFRRRYGNLSPQDREKIIKLLKGEGGSET